MELRAVLESVLAGDHLRAEEAETLMGQVLDGAVPSEWLAGFLAALRAKGEHPDEITGFARAMRRHATEVSSAHGDLIDTCGTGGDGAHTFNVSTAAALVVVGAGGRVAKHGNRSVSSRCGSADVLEALGARLDIGPVEVGRCIDEVGLGFLFAPALHAAMRHAVAARRALGIRTVFNLLGPLTNPARARHQVIGVYDHALLDSLGPVLVGLEQGASLVVRGRDGLDELSVCAVSDAVMVDGGVRRLEIDPATLGLGPHPAEGLIGGDAERNATIVRSVLDGEPGPPRDIVLLNAAAALWVGGRCSDLREGIEAAAAAVDSGRARAVLDDFVRFTRRVAGEAA